VEGGRGNLESQADEHQGHGDIGKNRSAGAQRLADGINIGRAGGAEHQRYAVKEKRGGERSQEKVLKRRLAARSFAAPKACQHIAGDRGNFERYEDQHQFDSRRHQAHADRAEQDQRVILAGADTLHRHVFVGGEDDNGRDHNDQEVKKDAEALDPNHAPERGSGIARHQGGGQKGG
jgi:hypothetical protein